MKIRVDIERLILDGVDLPAGQRPVLQAAIEAELARLLAGGGLHPALAGGQALPGLRVNAGPWPAASGPAQLGQQVARSIYGGLGAPEAKPK